MEPTETQGTPNARNNVTNASDRSETSRPYQERKTFMETAPTAHHNLTPAMLDEATAQEIAALTANELNLLRIELSEHAMLLKARSDVLQTAISLRYITKAKAQLRANQLDTGTTHIIEGDLDIAVNIPKSVSWDQPGLMAALDTMPIEDARHYADFSVKVSETTFKGAPPAIKHKLEKHRTVKPGKPKIEFKAAKKD